MAPHLYSARRVLIEALLTKGFESKLIASKASCAVRAVQRIQERRQSEMPTRTARVGRRSCTTSPMREDLRNMLTKYPDSTDPRWQTSSIVNLAKGYQKDRSVGPSDQ